MQYKGLHYNEFIMIGEHKVPMPSIKGLDKKDVLFFEDKDAYWKRDEVVKLYRKIFFDFVPYHTKTFQEATLYDDDGILVSLNKDDSEWFLETLDSEMKRRANGVFIRIKNELVYLTGDYWFVLMWCRTKRADKKGDWFDYREFQRDFFYLIQYVNNSEVISGLFISKAKKTGITNLMWLYYLNKSTRTRNINLSNMNIDRDKGAKTFRDHFMYAFNGLPMIFKPDWKNKSEIEGTIIFGKKYNNSKKSKLLANAGEDELNTTVMCVPAAMNALDVDVFSDNWYDEPPKYKGDFGEIYRSNNAATSLQDFMVGKRWLTSYTPDESGTSFFAAREIFMDSELRTITPNSNGQTKSKLICYHIPAFKSWTTSFDKYGVCDEKDAMRKIQFGRDQLKSKPRELSAETRKYANTKREAWSTGGVGSTFDNMRVGEILADLEIDQHNQIENSYIEGNLEWINALWNIGLRNKRKKGEFCPVKFVPLTDDEKEKGVNGKFRMYHQIPTAHQNMALKNGRDEWGLLPPEKFIYVQGGDPTNYAAGSEVIEGSKNAGFIMSMPDEILDSKMRGVASKIIYLEYYDRPELPDEAFEDFLMMIIYTGCLSLIEGNASYVATRLLEEGLGKFMLIKDENGIITTWKRWMGLPNEKEKKYQLVRITSNSATNKEMLEMIVRVIKNYIGTPAEGEKDYGATIKSERLLRQIMDFSPLDTRLYDLVMAFGYTLLTIELYLDMLLTHEQEYNNPINIESVLRALAS